MEDSKKAMDPEINFHYENDDIELHKPTAMTLEKFKKDYALQTDEEATWRERICQQAKNRTRCSKKRIKNGITSIFPFIENLRNYNPRKDLICDIIAGLSVGCVHIPQGLGFALLTEVPPICGLYTSFYPVLIFFLFTRCRFSSIGSMALISLLVGEIVHREAPALYGNRNHGVSMAMNHTTNGSDFVDDQANRDAVHISISTSVMLMVGLMQTGMSFFRMGALASYMGTPFIQGFTTAAAFHIDTSQIKAILAIKFPVSSGAFKLPKTIIDIFSHITETSISALLTGFISMVILAIFKEGINERFKHKLPFPLPGELFVVVLGTLISHFTNLYRHFGTPIIGEVPAQLMPPQVPSFPNASNYVLDSLIIAIVAFAVSIAMTKIVAHRNHYKIDANQELFAYGMVNTISCFFLSFTVAVAPPRCFVREATGRSQIASLIAAVLVLLVILFIGPLFFSLPIAVLGAIIIMALKPLIWQFKTLPNYWRVNKYDFATWIVTFLSSVLLDMIYGLVIGLLFSMVTIILQSQKRKGVILGRAYDSLFVPKKIYKTKEIAGTKIFRFSSAIYFATGERFTSELHRVVGSPDEIGQKSEKTNQKIVSCSTIMGDLEKVENKSNKLARINSSLPICQGSDITLDEESQPIEMIVIDCTLVSYIDTVGCVTLKDIHNAYKKVKVKVVFANISEEVMATMVKYGLDKMVGSESIFPSIQEAVGSYELDTEPEFHLSSSDTV